MLSKNFNESSLIGELRAWSIEDSLVSLVQCALVMMQCICHTPYVLYIL